MAHDVLLVEAEQLQNILISRATGVGDDTTQYRELRAKFLADPQVKDLLPDVVRTHRNLGEFWNFIKAKFAHYQERRAYIWAQFHPLLDALENGLGAPGHEGASEVLAKLDADHVRRHWQKALARVAADPEGAITSAKALVESVCKLILDTQGLTYDGGDDLNKLYKSAARSLKLGVDQHDPQVFKQILTGCASVVGGLAAVRNALGDAHGQGARPVRPAPRHADLAVNLAGAMATFLLETFEATHGTALQRRDVSGDAATGDTALDI
jgi:hypothetical protein